MGRKITYSMPEQQFKSNYEVLILFFAFASANYMSENELYLKHGFSHEEDTWNIVIHSLLDFYAISASLSHRKGEDNN